MIPLLTPLDISSRITHSPKSPRCLGSHALNLKHLPSGVMVSSIALVNHYLIRSEIYPSVKSVLSDEHKVRSAFLWNVCAALLGQLDGQSDDVLLTLKKLPPSIKSKIDAYKEGQLYDGPSSIRTANLRSTERVCSPIRFGTPKTASNDSQVRTVQTRPTQASNRGWRPTSINSSLFPTETDISQMDLRSFHDVIYTSRQQLKNYQLMEESYCWPTTVDVMDDTYILSGPYCITDTNEPGNMYAWVELQFRSLHGCSVNDISHCLRIWWGLYEQIIQWLIDEKRYGNVRWPAVQSLIYNTTWTLLGYNDEEQDISAIQLAAELMASPSFQKYAPAHRAPAFEGISEPEEPPKPAMQPRSPYAPPTRPTLAVKAPPRPGTPPRPGLPNAQKATSPATVQRGTTSIPERSFQAPRRPVPPRPATRTV